MLAILAPAEARVRFGCAPAERAVVSFTTMHDDETLALVVERADGRHSEPLPYVEIGRERRSSLGGTDGVARIEIDVVRADAPIVGIEVRSAHPLATAALSTPPDARRGTRELTRSFVLAVPQRSQYDPAHPEALGWCLPASLAMLLGTWGIARDVPSIAARVYDDAIGGTGNWTLGTAVAGEFGLIGATAFLSGLPAAEALIAARLPFAASIRWEDGNLPGAPLARSDGHLVVVRGFDDVGDIVVNDPAQPSIATTYPRTAFERSWLGHGGVALLVAPPRRAGALIRAANR